MDDKENLPENVNLSQSSQQGSQPQFSASQKQNAPRLLITKLVLENFKSYAGRQEVGPFHHCFSAVVGPNGSGKSNVIDAILFVFGKQAKKLRLKKMSELIHRSEQFPDLDYVRVEVHFVDAIAKNDDEFEEVPGTRVVVSRVVNRNESSQYYVNKEKKKRSEVVDLLKSRGIDLDNNRFLILQGEVEQIAMMKPKGASPDDVGMLEYLEDIIGSNKYVQPIEEAYKELETLNEDRTEKLNRAKVVEKEKDALEGSKAEAEEYLKTESEIIDKTAILYALQRNQHAKKVEGVRKQQEDLTAKLENHRSEMERLQEQASTVEEQFNKYKAEYDEIAENLKNAKSEFESFERKDVKLQEEIKHIKNKIKKLSKTLKEEQKKFDEKKASSKMSSDDIEKYKVEIEELTQKMTKEEKTLEKMREAIKDEVAPLHVKLSEKQKEYMPYQKKLDVAQGERDVVQSELDLLKQRSEQAVQQLEKAKQDLADSETTLGERKQEMADIKKKIEASKKKLIASKKEVDNIAADDVRLTDEIRELRTKEEEISSQLQQNKTNNKILSALMEEKAKGKLPGVYGRLGDLGAIDSKYDVAISTACKALDFIVVDTTETGQQCVDLLKKKNLGRTTFIIMDKIQHLNNRLNNPKNQPPAQSERLVDLIKVKDKKFMVAFYFGLHDTLVTADLKVATKIAYGATRWRVVTLAGQLIDQSGTMSGGGKVAKGGMSSQLQEDPAKLKAQIEGIKAQIDEKTKDLKQIRERYEALQTEIKDLEKEISRTETELKKKDLDMTGLAKLRDELEARIPELEKKTGMTGDEKKKIKELEGKIAKHQDDIDGINKASAKLSGEIKTLEEKIAGAGGLEMKAQKTKVDDLSAQIDNATSAMTKMEVQMKSADKVVKKAEKVITETKEEIAQLETDLAEKEAQMKQLTDDAMKVQDSFKETEGLYEESGKKLKKIRKEHDKIKAELNQLRTVEVDLNNKLEDVTKIVKDSEHRQVDYTKKISALEKKKQTLKILETDPDEPLPIPENEGELEEYNVDDLTGEIAQLEEQLTRMKPNMNAIKEYRKKEEIFRQRIQELDEITEKRDGKRKDYEELRKKRLEEFMAGFAEISMKLKEMYQMITLGGDAELELNDNLDPFSEGITFSVRPPKKSWKNISNLSGGEKTLSSLALVFALHHYKPTPLYIMDEIDAALDFKNVSIVANYIKERTKNAQFIIVSLRNYMFELADRLVGIYKTYNCTKSVAINPKSFVAPVHDEQRNNGDDLRASQTASELRSSQTRSGFRPVNNAEATGDDESDALTGTEEEGVRKSKSRAKSSRTEEEDEADEHEEEDEVQLQPPKKKQKTQKK